MRFFDSATIGRIREGYYSAIYFNRTKEILLGENNLKEATMQIFQRKEGSVLCGVEEVKELLKYATGYFEIINNQPPLNKKIQISKNQNFKWTDKSDSLNIESLKDGEVLEAGESVMHITGPYVYFAHLESVYLGILARRTLVATNVRRCKKAAGKKKVTFFADRFDYFLNQEGDGYAAHYGGADGVCTKAHARWWGGEASGTIPHSLIAMYGGDTVRATELFAKYYGNINTRDREFLAPQLATGSHSDNTFTRTEENQTKDLALQSSECDLRNSQSSRIRSSVSSALNKQVNVIALVDFHNDCVRTSLEVARKLGRKLWGVRLDTSMDMADRSLQGKRVKGKGESGINGVNPQLVRNVRKALDENGFAWVKIVVSGGFDAEKIKSFEEEKTPVDVYGVGSAMLKGANDFTADIVKVEGREIAKEGRRYRAIRVKGEGNNWPLVISY